jgi:hypothetical protein
MDLREICSDDMKLVGLGYPRIQWQASVRTMINLALVSWGKEISQVD